MGLSNKKEEQLRKMPYIDVKMFKSKDGRYIVHKTTITDIKPVAYYEKVLTSEALPEQEEVIDLTEAMVTA